MCGIEGFLFWGILPSRGPTFHLQLLWSSRLCPLTLGGKVWDFPLEFQPSPAPLDWEVPSVDNPFARRWFPSFNQGLGPFPCCPALGYLIALSRSRFSYFVYNFSLWGDSWDTNNGANRGHFSLSLIPIFKVHRFYLWAQGLLSGGRRHIYRTKGRAGLAGASCTGKVLSPAVRAEQDQLLSETRQGNTVVTWALLSSRWGASEPTNLSLAGSGGF